MKFLKTFILVLLLALVNCDVGRSDGDTDDDTQQAGVVANIEEDKTPDTATKAETVSSPNANVSNVSSTGKPVPGSKPKEDEGGNKDANTGTNDNDGDEDHSEDSDDASQPDHKLTEADLKKTPSTNTTGEAKPNEINDNQPDTPNTSTQKSDTDSTPKDKTSTKSITSTTISTSTSTRTTTSTTSTTTTTTKESGDEGEDVYTDDEDITNGKTKDDPQADTNVVSETTTSKATGKTKDLEPVSVLEDEDEAKIEADLKTQNYFMGGIAAIMMVLIIVYYKKQSKGEATPAVRYQRIDENDEEMGVMIPRNDETTDDEAENDVWRWS